MAVLRSFDAFAKPVEGTRTTTATGGVITVLATLAASVLFLSQLYLYIGGDVRHSLHLSESSTASALNLAIPDAGSEKIAASRSNHPVHQHVQRRRLNQIPLSVHLTFPHIRCSDIDYDHDGASKSSGRFERIHGRDAFRISTATPVEMATILGKSEAQKHRNSPGCTVRGTISVPRVGGSLSVTISGRAWKLAASLFQQELMSNAFDPTKIGQRPNARLPNCTHHIHSITFGEPFPPAVDPLRETTHVIDNDSGVALHNVAVRLVPTRYERPWRRARDTYQSSVVSHIVQPQTLAQARSTSLPGITIGYDFTPLAVHHVERRENLFVFLGSLVSIVGGVFVTVGLVTGCLVGGVSAAVSKKSD
mmetsp:Transcript_20370/g.44476  ORF Transcript_20370/g.44476 Transcript_20370/m.44476 type:complete len:364 (+) Transcript_20370:195-1286(+)|eukprot:CAMPEP_0178496370 /NCGR_PEP_ID=MMETSP0696-20121128/14080_1 /TAXON_ID=265572 /ORGANISM="Extubocellulus spinifer, Strain CCMP396" /LENGTH=363 /DNA_ID=CAMNT_0020124647 /DNA_START=146 /DNA_END=1237 /DNA_ORIENTATION=-